MELNQDLINQLLKLGMNIQSLSLNEKVCLNEIFNIFQEFIEKDNKLNLELKKNKFNKSIVATKINFSRQTLYKNPTLFNYLEWCIREANEIMTKRELSEIASYDKYARLKEENQSLIIQIVDDAIKDEEIKKLISENSELKKRIVNLLKRFEEKNSEVNLMKKKSTN